VIETSGSIIRLRLGRLYFFGYITTLPNLHNQISGAIQRVGFRGLFCAAEDKLCRFPCPVHREAFLFRASHNLFGFDMKVVKHFSDEREAKAAMNIFDRVLNSTYCNWPLERLEVFLTDSEHSDSWIEGSSAKIFIGKNHHFIQEMDTKGTEALFLSSLNSLMLKMKGFETTELRQYFHGDEHLFRALLMLEDFASSRMVAMKFPNEIFYKSLDRINRSKPGNFMDELETWLSCLAFYKIDQWNMEYLKKIAEARTGKKIDSAFIEEMKKLLDSSSRAPDKDDMKSMMNLVRKHMPA
jgi:hypothetical protein